MKQEILEVGKQVLRTLEEAGYAAYFVGGYVRDRLLDRPVHDLDIATSARPEQVMALFPRTIPTGLAHGTVTVLEQGIPLEVTTFRTESGYKDHRRPDTVEFVANIEEDLARRDFTVNAMALDLRDNVIDPFGGQHDLSKRIIRAVGNPDERFGEDALRMLRCLRFASQLGFSIDPATYEAVRKRAADIRYVAVERINVEWNKALAGPYPDVVITASLDTGLAASLPGIERLFAEKQGWSDTEQAQLRRLPNLVSRWAYVFLTCGRMEEVETILRALRSEKKLIKACRHMVDLAMLLAATVSKDKLASWVLEYGMDAMREAVLLHQVRSETEELLPLLMHVYETMQVKQVQDLVVSGADLQKELARKGGSWIRDVLFQLAREVNSGHVVNERQALLYRARMIVDEYT
jgi:tRNA nucleotidyltransferase (CCA-adding enzyme)